MDATVRWVLLPVQVIALALSCALFLTTFLTPEIAEDSLRKLAISKVDRAVEYAIFVEPSTASNRIRGLADQLELAALTIEGQREKIVTAVLGVGLVGTCVKDCDFWKEASEIVDASLVQRAAKFRIAEQTLQDFAVGQYETALQSLRKDLQRFSAVNVVVLTLMSLLLITRTGLGRSVVTFSAAITAYTLWASYGYFFDQNWVLTLLLNDWAAPGYQITMIFVSLVLADWVFLRATLTNLVLSAIASVC